MNEDLVNEIILSEEECPYDIPDCWVWTTLQRIAILKSGSTINGVVDDNSDDLVPYVKVSDMNLLENDLIINKANQYVSKSKNNLSKVIPKNSIIFPKRGGAISTNKKRIVSKEIFIDSNTMAMVCPEKIDINYLFNWFLTIDLGKLNSGSTVPQINNGDINPLKIPIPPFNEQKRIIKTLDGLLTAIEETKKKLAKTKELIKKRHESLLQKAFRGQLVEHDESEGTAAELIKQIEEEKNKESKKKIKIETIPEEEQLHDIPNQWSWVRLEDVFLKITDGTHHSPPNGPVGEFKYITAKNIKESGIDLSNLTYVTKEVHEQIYSRCNPEYGDILYIKDGATTGIAIINTLQEEFSMLSSVALLKTHQYIDSRYATYWLNSKLAKDIYLKTISGSAITRFTLNKINNFMIPVPSLSEQKRIANYLENEFKKEESILVMVEGTNNYLNNMRKSLLQKAFCGELVEQRPEEGTGLDLLKEIIEEKVVVKK